MNIGDIVAVATKVDEVVTKVPAIVTAVYKNVHGEVVADLHQLEATIHSVVSVEENPREALPENGPVVTTDLTPPAPATSETAAGPDTQTVSAQDSFAALSPEDQAKFLEDIGAQKA